MQALLQQRTSSKMIKCVPTKGRSEYLPRRPKLVDTALMKRICELGFEAVARRESYVRQICQYELKGCLRFMTCCWDTGARAR